MFKAIEKKTKSIGIKYQAVGGGKEHYHKNLYCFVGMSFYRCIIIFIVSSAVCMHALSYCPDVYP